MYCDSFFLLYSQGTPRLVPFDNRVPAFAIKEFRIMGLSINDSVHSCLFFFLTGLHFFHLLFGLLLLGLFFWGCSFPSKSQGFVSLRVSEVHLFYNLMLFYWHFLEILWLFLFLVF